MKFIPLMLLSLSSPLITGQLLHRREDSFAVPTVNTTSGLVSGHPAANSTGVSVYLGIPFAAPPIGELRFAPPEPYSGNTSINGTNFGFTCPAASSPPVSAHGNITIPGANILSIIGQSALPLSEDCLTLNIWVPSGGEENKAVLLWIYGGGFAVGSSAVPFYDGQYIAEQEDVIIVTINYRLNIFGFPGNPAELNANLGLLDQRFAVKWTRDNIPAFGGDPSRITMFGQSAGSASLEYYAYAWAEEPIITGMIQESGSIGHQSSTPRQVVEHSWFYVTNALGCGDASSDPNEVVQCMRRKDMDEILALVPGFAVPSNLTFYPAVDDITIFSDYEARSRAGKFSKVPLLIGNTDFEGGLSLALEMESSATPHSKEYWERDYDQFSCTISERANISTQYDIPTWRYRYFGAWPNMQLTTYPDSGSWHTIDVLGVFDFIPKGPGIPDETSAQVSTGNYMRGAWAAFAKDPKEGLKTYEDGWPVYDPQEDTLIRLAYHNMTGANLGSTYPYDKGCNTTFPVYESGSSSGTNSTPTTSGSGSPFTPTSTLGTTNDGSRLGGSLAFVFWMAIVTTSIY